MDSSRFFVLRLRFGWGEIYLITADSVSSQNISEHLFFFWVTRINYTIMERKFNIPILYLSTDESISLTLLEHNFQTGDVHPFADATLLQNQGDYGRE